jgi:hypothetical protein
MKADPCKSGLGVIRTEHTGRYDKEIIAESLILAQDERWRRA